MVGTAHAPFDAMPRLTSHPVMFLSAPALTMIIASPLAGGVFDRTSHTFWGMLLSVPFWVGLLSAPGYFAVLTVDPQRLRALWIRRLWVRLSLGLGLACAAVGIWVGSFTIVFAVPPALTAVCCMVLWWRFERVGWARGDG